MRVSITLLVMAVLAATAAAQDAPQTKIKVTLEDGSILNATVSIRSVGITSNVGTVDVAIDKIKNIKFSAVGDEIVTAESTLKGKIKWDNVKAKSDLGELTLYREHLRSVEVTAAAVEAPAQPKPPEAKPADEPNPQDKPAETKPQDPKSQDKPAEVKPAEAKPQDPKSQDKPTEKPQEDPYVPPDMGFSDAEHEKGCLFGAGKFELDFFQEFRRSDRAVRYDFGAQDKREGSQYVEGFNTCRQCRGIGFAPNGASWFGPYDPDDECPFCHGAGSFGIHRGTVSVCLHCGRGH